MKIKTAILITAVTLWGCSKDNKQALSTNLTDCPANFTCNYNYYDDADFTDFTQPVAGKYRVFWYKSIVNNSCGLSRQLYFKEALNSGYFEIDGSQIAAGQVVGYNFNCPCCDLFLYTQPIGGFIKGTKTDANIWLVNASIIFGTADKKAVDTLTINQYYTQAKLP